jgi:hypothetical protein
MCVIYISTINQLLLIVIGNLTYVLKFCYFDDMLLLIDLLFEQFLSFNFGNNHYMGV